MWKRIRVAPLIPVAFSIFEREKELLRVASKAGFPCSKSLNEDLEFFKGHEYRQELAKLEKHVYDTEKILSPSDIDRCVEECRVIVKDYVGEGLPQFDFEVIDRKGFRTVWENLQKEILQTCGISNANIPSKSPNCLTSPYHKKIILSSQIRRVLPEEQYIELKDSVLYNILIEEFLHVFRHYVLGEWGENFRKSFMLQFKMSNDDVILLQGTNEALAHHGREEIAEKYMPKIIPTAILERLGWEINHPHYLDSYVGAFLLPQFLIYEFTPRQLNEIDVIRRGEDDVYLQLDFNKYHHTFKERYDRITGLIKNLVYNR